MTAPTPLLAPDADDPASAHQRADERNNMFVVAVLYADGGSAPVRVRNMSPGGALIECAAIPPEGSEVRLGRGSLDVHGSVVWRRENRAGIQFQSSIAVTDWLPRGGKSSDQQRVDAIVQACRRPAPQSQPIDPAALTPSKAETIRQLLDLRASLNQAAGELASDARVVAGFPDALQTLDLAAQKLEKLAGFLAERS